MLNDNSLSGKKTSSNSLPIGLHCRALAQDAAGSDFEKRYPVGQRESCIVVGNHVSGIAAIRGSDSTISCCKQHEKKEIAKRS